MLIKLIFLFLYWFWRCYSHRSYKNKFTYLHLTASSIILYIILASSYREYARIYLHLPTSYNLLLFFRLHSLHVLSWRDIRLLLNYNRHILVRWPKRYKSPFSHTVGVGVTHGHKIWSGRYRFNMSWRLRYIMLMLVLFQISLVKDSVSLRV